jgi:hypothetical protein
VSFLYSKKKTSFQCQPWAGKEIKDVWVAGEDDEEQEGREGGNWTVGLRGGGDTTKIPHSFSARGAPARLRLLPPALDEVEEIIQKESKISTSGRLGGKKNSQKPVNIQTAVYEAMSCCTSAAWLLTQARNRQKGGGSIQLAV